MRHAVEQQLDGIDVDIVMREAILATRSTHPHPNPRVGAVILSPSGAVRARGVHIEPGTDHAERVAIGDVPHVGATLFTTLEPCNHHGRTPPCTEAIINAGISRVVVGAIDPDPAVAGAGVERLRAEGIEVVTGVLTSEVEANDRSYFHHRRTGRAFVTLKMAATLDGKAKLPGSGSRWITSEEARLDVHKLRSEHDGVLVGGGTLIADDPTLDVRIEGFSGPQPRPILVLGRRSVPESSKVMRRDPLVFEDADGVDLLALLRDVPASGVLSVLVEGGPTIAGSLLRSGLVDQMIWYAAPTIAGDAGLPSITGTFETMTEQLSIQFTEVQHMGGDIKIVADVSYRAIEEV